MKNIDYLDLKAAADKVELLDAIAQANFQLGLYQRAESLWLRVYQLIPDNQRALIGLAQVAVINQDAAAARQWIEKIEENHSITKFAGHPADLWLIKSGVAELSGDDKKALVLARQAYNFFQREGLIQQQLSAAHRVGGGGFIRRPRGGGSHRLLTTISESRQPVFTAHPSAYFSHKK